MPHLSYLPCFLRRRGRTLPTFGRLGAIWYRHGEANTVPAIYPLSPHPHPRPYPTPTGPATWLLSSSTYPPQRYPPSICTDSPATQLATHPWQSNPYAIVAIEKTVNMQAGRVIRHAPQTQPHPSHLEARRQLRTFIGASTEGQAHKQRELRHLMTRHDVFKEKRRRLGWSDANFLYQLDGGVSNPSLNDEFRFFARSWGVYRGNHGPTSVANAYAPFDDDWVRIGRISFCGFPPFLPPSSLFSVFSSPLSVRLSC